MGFAAFRRRAAALGFALAALFVNLSPASAQGIVACPTPGDVGALRAGDWLAGFPYMTAERKRLELHKSFGRTTEFIGADWTTISETGVIECRYMFRRRVTQRDRLTGLRFPDYDFALRKNLRNLECQPGPGFVETEGATQVCLEPQAGGCSLSCVRVAY